MLPCVQQQLSYSHYTSQPALAGTPEDFVGAKFWLREKMLEFSSVMFTYTICIPFYFYGRHM